MAGVTQARGEGAGLFRGAYEVSKDSCLYTEDWLLRLAAQRTGGSFASDRIVRYYLGAYRVRCSTGNHRLCSCFALLVPLVCDVHCWPSLYLHVLVGMRSGDVSW